MITVIYAHPYPQHSRANKALLHAIHELPEIHIRNLYDLYPDFHIDTQAEQIQLIQSHTVVLQHPLHWYHTPALLSLWFEKVLTFGWAYGTDAQGQTVQALKDKRLLWAATAGGDRTAYCEEGYNHFPMAQLSSPIQQTALFCGMNWLEPFTVYNAGKISDEMLLQTAEAYRDRIVALLTTDTGVTTQIDAKGADDAW